MENIIDSIRPVCDQIILWGKGEIPFPTCDVEESFLRWAAGGIPEHRWIHAQQILIYSMYGLPNEKIEEASQKLRSISFKTKL